MSYNIEENNRFLNREKVSNQLNKTINFLLNLNSSHNENLEAITQHCMSIFKADLVLFCSEGYSGIYSDELPGPAVKEDRFKEIRGICLQILHHFSNSSSRISGYKVEDIVVIPDLRPLLESLGIPRRKFGAATTLWSKNLNMHENRTATLCLLFKAFSQPTEDDAWLLHRLGKAAERELSCKYRLEAIKKREKKYRNLVEELNDVIFVINTEGIITYVNRGIKRLLGYNPSQVIGKTFAEVSQYEKSFPFRDNLEEIQPNQIITDEYRIITKADEVKWVRISSYPIFHGANLAAFQGVVTDISQWKAMQNHLVRTERLAATGQLAASVAHEINSPLQGVITHLDYMKMAYQDNSGLLEDIGMVSNAFYHIKDTVAKLLDLNRPGKEKVQLVRINQIINNTVALVQNYIKKSHINIELNLAKDLPEIEASPGQLFQVFLNLINNAVEAVQDKYQGDAELGMGAIRIVSYFKDDYIFIDISDTGIGINEMDLKYIFQPFFSKKKAMSMGIGLSICHSIIKEHKGAIEVKNFRNQGTSFIIKLPASPRA